jgi:hypothetical protein
MARLMEPLPEATRVAIEPFLATDERVTHVVTAVGCSLILTDRQLVLVREGLNYRPRSGVQTWPLDSALAVRSTPVRHGSGRLVIDRKGRSTSVFVSAEQWPEAETLLGMIRTKIRTNGR